MYTTRVTTPYRYRARGTFYLLMVGIFALIAVTAVLFAKGYSINPKTGIVAKTALVVLGSTPSKAEIKVNGVIRKETTNTRIKLSPGSYDISVSKSGTIPYQKSVIVSSGNAILEEDILLFLQEPTVRTLSETSNCPFVISPNGRQVMYCSADQNGTAIWQSQVDANATPQRVSLIPADFGQVTNISLSSDLSRLAVSSTTSTVILTSSGDQLMTTPFPGAVFSGTRNDTLIIRKDQQWITLDVPSGKQTPLSPTTIPPAGSGDLVYTASGQTISRVDRNGAVVSITAPEAVVGLAANPASQTVYVLTASKHLYQVVSETLLPIDSNVERFNPSRDDSAVVTADAGEFRIWRRETGKVSLVTRFSEAPTVFRVHKNGHYIYFERGGQLHAIATDGSNDTTISSLGSRSEITDSYSQVRLDGAKLESVTLLEP